MRVALKLATGAGKTTVMAMLIAWQTVNAVRRSTSKHFTRGFLVCAPGLTIKDRLRVLQPNDPDSYYASREIVPNDMLDAANHAKIVITNFHGSAGTGKTIVALHRAAHLARMHPNARVLLTTFSDTLANALRTNLKRLLSSEPRLAERIDVYSLNAIGVRLYKAHVGQPTRRAASLT